MLNLSSLLERFSERTPLPVMARGLLERHLSGAALDDWFENVAEKQYTKKLLFSSLYDLMTQVVFRHQPSVNTAYQNAVQPLNASLSAVYAKLNNIETQTSAALVSLSADKSAALIQEMGAEEAAIIPGYRIRILDGNALGARAHRLAVTRSSTAAPLPGKSLNVYEPALGLITHTLPCEDAYTQERALLSSLAEQIEVNDLWVADRNFCTTDFLTELQARGAAGLIREHGQIRFQPLKAMGDAVRIETGEVSEQRIQLTTGGKEGILLRRIRVKLDKPDRNGEDSIYLLTQVPPEKASAAELADLYRKRWKIEVAFLKMTVQLRCEINTLGYPKAALFGFAVAAVAFNALAVIMAALRVAHPEVDIEQEVSTYYIANEMANMAESLDTIIDTEDWQPIADANQADMAEWLVTLAKRAQLRKYKKHPRGKKKPAQPRSTDPKKPHVSTARLLRK
uniref:Transposase IS4 family protein n=1 Tax=uncultured Thiotrichaceae bacterium TaxID=298394 RepID=A0A6S6UJT7_9GAMM|nr:MAG: Transposase IS4 family protein [uncultured Thiotrichaceae bacterium]